MEIEKSDENEARKIWEAYKKLRWGSSMSKVSSATGIDYDKVRMIVPRLVLMDLLEPWGQGHRAIGDFHLEFEDET